MSKKKPQDKPAKKPEEAELPDAEDAGTDTSKKQDDGAKKGLDYIFKIAPVDPKNAFDFEDIADK